jgi:hypothetical protein
VADGSSHAKHDRFAIADAVGGVTPTIVAACPSCGALFADLTAIRAAIGDARVPSRTRDFLLTTADAARLRPAGWRRFVAAIGTQRDAITRPIALTCTGLGLAGLLLTTIPFGTIDGAGGAPAAASEAPAEVPYDVHILGEPAPPVASDKRVRHPAATTPLAGLSIGLLAAGGAVFAARHIAPRLGRVR